jgi:hypothetical protein
LYLIQSPYPGQDAPNQLTAVKQSSPQRCSMNRVQDRVGLSVERWNWLV